MDIFAINYRIERMTLFDFYQINKANKNLKNIDKMLIFSILSIFFFNKSTAQNYTHTAMWTRLQVSKQFNEQWSGSLEYQHRRQNNYLQSKFNPLPEPLLNMGRIIINYRPENWQYSLQISHFRAHQLLAKESDFERPMNKELRIVPSIEYFHLNKLGQFQWRTQYEYRIFTDRLAGRFRSRILERFTLNPKNDLITSFEPLFSVPPERNKLKLLEQVQLSLTLQHAFNQYLRCEFGYRYLYRLRRTTTEIDHENAIVTGLLFGF